MIARPTDQVSQIEQSADDAVSAEEHQNVELAWSVRQPVPELGTVERCRLACRYVQVFRDSYDFVAALFAQVAAGLKLPLR
jgi:hypothetical protein